MIWLQKWQPLSQAPNDTSWVFNPSPLAHALKMPCANPILNLSKSCLWSIKTDRSASLRYAVSHAGVKNGLPINISESEEILKLMVFQCPTRTFMKRSWPSDGRKQLGHQHFPLGRIWHSLKMQDVLSSSLRRRTCRRRTCSNYYLQIGSEYQPPEKQWGNRTLKNSVLTWKQRRGSKVAVKGSRPILVGNGNNQTS